MSEPTGKLSLRSIKPDDNVAGLSLGVPEAQPLKTFLKKHALSYEAAHFARTYVVVDEASRPKVWAYVTLICSSIEAIPGHKVDDCRDAARLPDYPAIKIARLAVDQALQGRGIGKELIAWSISISRDVMRHLGCRVLIVDSKPSAVSFYTNAGFTLLNSAKNISAKTPILFLDLHRLP